MRISKIPKENMWIFCEDSENDPNRRNIMNGSAYTVNVIEGG